MAHTRTLLDPRRRARATRANADTPLPGFGSLSLTRGALRQLLDRHASHSVSRYRRLWSYYRNPGVESSPEGTGPASRHLAQRCGLPGRLRGEPLDDDRRSPREIVIENDIAWRIDAMVDFLLREPISILSLSDDEETRHKIERILDATLEASGGAQLIHDILLLGAIYGHVDVLVRTDELFSTRARSRGLEGALELASSIRVEPIVAERGIPLLDPSDYRTIDAYIVHSSIASLTERDARTTITDVYSATHHVQLADSSIRHSGVSRLGVLPVVHMQNRSQPLHYEGLSEVEPLIPLQDELNTRLSDRANRVTMQSFKMYLAKGIDAFGASGTPASIGPGQIWSTDNPDASIQSFGGDASSPSEDAHIEQIRQALDKTSGITPVAAGVIRERIGQLSSENALRVTFMGMLAKSQRKQLTYGRGIAQICRLILLALDRAGVYPTTHSQRDVRVVWPDPIPTSEPDRLESAREKIDLGVPDERVLAELGYAPGDQGVV
ncbi:MAG: phage portal protein [Phycisphaerales bacterium JB043]